MQRSIASSWSRERTRLLTQEPKIRFAVVAFVGFYLAMRPEQITHPLRCLAAVLLMLGVATVVTFGLRVGRLAAAGSFELAAALLAVLDLFNVTLLVAGTGSYQSVFFLLYPLPLMFAAAFFRGIELALLTGLGALFYALVAISAGGSNLSILGLRLAATVLIVWQGYALTRVLHGEKQGNDQLLRHLAEGVIVLDDRGRVVLANEAFASMFGVNAAELEGRIPAEGDESELLAWVLQDTGSGPLNASRSVRIGQFPEADLPLLEVTTIACREYAQDRGGWVVVCRDLRDQAEGNAGKAGDGALEEVSPLANLRALSQTLYTLAERLDDSERWHAVSLIERHTVAMQVILTRLLQNGTATPELGLDSGVVNLQGLLNSTRRLLEIRDEGLEVGVEVECEDDLPELRLERGALGRLLLRSARALLRFARPLDHLRLSSRQDGARVVVELELCPPPAELAPRVALDHLHPRIDEELRREMEGLSRLLMLCGAVWTLRRVVADYYRLELSLPVDLHEESAEGVEGFERPTLPEGIEFLSDITLNRLNNLVGAIRGRAELALMWPQKGEFQEALVSTIERADELSEVLEKVVHSGLTRTQPPLAQPVASVMAEPLPLPSSTRPVLIVDDEPAVRELLSGMFSTCGCPTAQARDAQEAIAYLNTQRPSLALVDLYMPGAHGTEVLKMARERYPDLPVVIMSGGGIRGVDEAVTEHEPDAVLTKPFSLKQVLELARQAQDKAS